MLSTARNVLTEEYLIELILSIIPAQSRRRRSNRGVGKGREEGNEKGRLTGMKRVEDDELSVMAREGQSEHQRRFKDHRWSRVGGGME